MTKGQLTEALAAKTETSNADAGRLLDAVIDTLTETLASGEEVALAGFGKFVVKDRAARQGRNPQTGETVEIAAARVVRFTPASKLKQTVNR